MDAVKLAALSLCACTITSIEPSSTTTGVPTNQILISVLSVSSDGELADAKIDVSVNGFHATLGSGDALRLVDGIGGAIAFAPGSGDGDFDFEAKLATSDTALAVQLVRNGAAGATVDIPLPPPFAPVAPTSAARASGVALTWQAAPSFPMEIVATGSPCLPAEGFTAHLEPDTGAFEIQPADMITSPGACAITVAFTRGLQQTQTRTVTVPTTP
jgi:hypothetical protein